jgi:hypothetical protein
MIAAIINPSGMAIRAQKTTSNPIRTMGSPIRLQGLKNSHKGNDKRNTKQAKR